MFFADIQQIEKQKVIKKVRISSKLEFVFWITNILIVSSFLEFMPNDFFGVTSRFSSDNYCDWARNPVLIRIFCFHCRNFFSKINFSDYLLQQGVAKKLLKKNHWGKWFFLIQYHPKGFGRQRGVLSFLLTRLLFFCWQVFYATDSDSYRLTGTAQRNKGSDRRETAFCLYYYLIGFFFGSK
jgi:hypothetical protein